MLRLSFLLLRTYFHDTLDIHKRFVFVKFEFVLVIIYVA